MSSSLPKGKSVDKKTMERIMNKILEDNKNTKESAFGAINGEKTNEQAY